MRLLQREGDGTFSLVEYVGEEVPPYAILSHVWRANNAEEVTFKDMMENKGEEKPGYRKLRFCGDQAAQDNLEHFWVDTCCIDKSSSAELSEAINSMYRWYKDAEICYVYLEDVSSPNGTHLVMDDFKDSKWFTRGWTLQELIAPSEIVFYSKEWEPIGAKFELTPFLGNVTGIDQQVLQGAHPSVCSIASRMSWAANRKTKRVEDIAYSLLGIFDINMPLLYGEGQRAFIRLQEEIMKDSNDQSLFAWQTNDLALYTGLLATSPKSFAISKRIASLEFQTDNEPFSTSSKGLCATFVLQDIEGNGLYCAYLACKDLASGRSCAIILQHIWGEQYVRVDANTLGLTDSTYGANRDSRREVFVKQNLFLPLQISRFPKDADILLESEWFWIRGTKEFQFSKPVSYLRWYPAIGLFASTPSQCGRLLVTHAAFLNQPMSLLFGVFHGQMYCLLEDPLVASPDLESYWQRSRLGTFHQRPIFSKTSFFKVPTVSMTAGVGLVTVGSRQTMVVTLCLKTSKVRFPM